MEVKEDATRCIILGKNHGIKRWELLYITERKSVAWRTKADIDKQMSLLKQKYEVMVVTEENYDKNKLISLPHPDGFELYPVVECERGKPAPKEQTVAPVAILSNAPSILCKPEKPVAGSGYQQKKCKYCDSEIPSNGAAQFAHLKKHINELVSKGVLQKVQADAIRSIKLSDEMDVLFSANLKPGEQPAQPVKKEVYTKLD